jgi:hypothetical protein
MEKIMHPSDHAKTSVRLFGGKQEDYLAIHDWMDASKAHLADFRHRAYRHHSEGIFEAERVFGHSIINSNGKEVHVRYICEQHVKEDCGGKIPTLSDWLSQIKVQHWMARGYRLDVMDEPENLT